MIADRVATTGFLDAQRHRTCALIWAAGGRTVTMCVLEAERCSTRAHRDCFASVPPVGLYGAV